MAIKKGRILKIELTGNITELSMLNVCQGLLLINRNWLISRDSNGLSILEVVGEPAIVRFSGLNGGEETTVKKFYFDAYDFLHSVSKT
jgi:hypothetical protein